MALINCPECNKDVSDSAAVCPHCGFAVAKFVFEKEEEEKRLEQAKARQEYRAQKQQQAEERKRRRAAAKKTYIKQFSPCGKKAFWLLAALAPYAVITAIAPYIKDFFLRKQYGRLPADYSILAWLRTNVFPILPTLALTAFTLFVIPVVLYVIANNVKNAKAGKILLTAGLVFTALLLLVAVAANIVNGFDEIILIRFFIPLCVYTFLYIKAFYKKV